ncbi:phytanoyl-CoA dioxygenase [Pedobacter yulinensis]|uniref:Phytanoyl-CoA dioxygenase n=1 Tax=Pedobacter yulinensis TaxID=2126353 RepID=A0A2T3HLA1_9SPHI|nr:phytanoyl-CoA dioxygenase family protein [Pedobacter yulinensis]PST83204.1 phytanoyl-CoA dioxygenase [Pedobacter yulinensis]
MQAESAICAALDQHGFALLPGIFDKAEVRPLTSLIDGLEPEGEKFRRRAGVFAIRQFLEAAPAVFPLIFNRRLAHRLGRIIPGFSLVRSVFFDKPEGSNWFVPPHQDLTIQLTGKVPSASFTNWTVKDGRFAAQPPVRVLEGMLTVRVHLDNTDESNGALQVRPCSHRLGIIETERVSLAGRDYVTCTANAGDVLLMKPLLLHRSLRSDAAARRRVIHLEFSADSLPDGARWSERQELPGTPIVSLNNQLYDF